MHTERYHWKVISDFPLQVVKTVPVCNRNTAFAIGSFVESEISSTTVFRNISVIVPESSILSLGVEIEPANMIYSYYECSSHLCSSILLVTWNLKQGMLSDKLHCHTSHDLSFVCRCKRPKGWFSGSSNEQNSNYSPLHLASLLGCTMILGCGYTVVAVYQGGTYFYI